MAATDAVLVRVLAHADAIRCALRSWAGFAGSNRYQWAEAGGVPYRLNTARDEGARKAGERDLAGLADAGFLTVARGARVKFPLCALTPRGDATARALAGLPGRAAGREFLERVAAGAARHALDPSGGGRRWCPEIDLNGGRGWGFDATREDRRGLVAVELAFLAAAAQGWAVASSTIDGHAAYAPTAAGLAELATPSQPPAVGALPAEDGDAAELYWREQAAKLQELNTRRPDNPMEIGSLPLSTAVLALDPAHTPAPVG